MAEKRVLGFVGLPGAGKSTALEVASEFGPVVTMGDVVRAEVKKRGLPPNPASLGMVARDLRETHGPDWIAKKCAEAISGLPERDILVDGLRSMVEVTVFKTQLARFAIVAVVADEARRHQWLQQRGRADDSVDPGTIEARDARERQFGVEEVIAAADYTIANDADVTTLKQRTKEVLQTFFAPSREASA